LMVVLFWRRLFLIILSESTSHNTAYTAHPVGPIAFGTSHTLGTLSAIYQEVD